MKKTLTTILVLVAVAAGIFFILRHNKEKNQEQVDIVAQKNADIAVRTAKVQYENMNGQFSVNGTFLANTTANISAEMGGQLVALYIREGSHVSPGQVIAKLKGDKLDVSVNNAKANLDNAQSALARYEAAFKTGGVTALQLDQAKLQVKNARAQYQAAQLNSGDTTVRSKVSGIVNKKMVEVGTFVNAGMTIAEVVDISSVKLNVDVDEGLVSKLSMGEMVKVKPSAVEGELNGRITFIAPASNGALKFPVEITVKNFGNQLKAGMYGTAVFGNDSAARMLVIPRDAFVGSVSENQVFVVKNNTAYLKKIQSGSNYGDKVEVISGLNPGDVVVTSGQINLTDGAKVSILK